MTDDIGPSDVVECIKDISSNRGPYEVPLGSRATVLETVRIERSERPCQLCGNATNGFRLVEYPTPIQWIWCPCAWRKVGGSLEDTVRLFEAYTRDKPEPIKRPERTFALSPPRALLPQPHQEHRVPLGPLREGLTVRRHSRAIDGRNPSSCQT